MEDCAMRRTSRGVLCASILWAFTAAAQNSGPASNGDFVFSLEGATGAIQYNARTQGGSSSGQMTFTGQLEISNEDVDGTGGGESAVSNVQLTVTIDCLRISENRAAMSGVVSSATVPGYTGVRALLAVEDGGEGKKEPGDRFTWGVYRPIAVTWMPEDSEVPGDNGATFTWYVTDAERPDDVPVLSNQSGGPVDCRSFSFDSYAFEDLPHGAGNIQVKP
jgi:hypothetical protein